MPETRKPKNEEAYIGKRGEEILIDILKNRRDVVECIEKLTWRSIGNVVEVIRGDCFNLWKTDVVLIGSTGERVGISLKTFRAGGRPDVHLDRRWLDKPSEKARPWSEVLEMPEDILKILREGILRKAEKKSRPLVQDSSDQQKVGKFLSKVIRKFLWEAFRNDERDLLILALLEYNNELKLCLFNLDEVIDFIEKDVQKKGIAFGSRIDIGNFIQWQRKAGNGKRVKIPKTDPRHPGNQLQVKLLARYLTDAAIKQISGCCFNLAESRIKPTHKSLENYLK